MTRLVVKRITPRPPSDPPLWRAAAHIDITVKERCVSYVHLADMNLNMTKQRVERAKRINMFPDQCGRPATHRINGKPHCDHHSGSKLLDMFAGKTVNFEVR